MDSDLVMIPTEYGKFLRFYKKHTVSYVDNDGKVRLLNNCSVIGDRLHGLTPWKVVNGRQQYRSVIIELYDNTVEEIAELVSIANA